MSEELNAHCIICGTAFRPLKTTQRLCSQKCVGHYGSSIRHHFPQHYRPKKSLSEKFEEFVHRGDPNVCWPWSGKCDPKGYGTMNYKGKNYRAHRVSYELAKEPIPEGLVILHACDNPPCVNPHHLSVGTIADNNRDCAAKGRISRQCGEIHGNSKLKTADVISIKAAVRAGQSTMSALAREYGVRRNTISRILAGERWGHIP